jgi:hypothetical protein
MPSLRADAPLPVVRDKVAKADANVNTESHIEWKKNPLSTTYCGALQISRNPFALVFVGESLISRPLQRPPHGPRHPISCGRCWHAPVAQEAMVFFRNFRCGEQSEMVNEVAPKDVGTIQKSFRFGRGSSPNHLANAGADRDDAACWRLDCRSVDLSFADQIVPAAICAGGCSGLPFPMSAGSAGHHHRMGFRARSHREKIRRRWLWGGVFLAGLLVCAVLIYLNFARL